MSRTGATVRGMKIVDEDCLAETLEFNGKFEARETPLEVLRRNVADDAALTVGDTAAAIDSTPAAAIDSTSSER